MGKRVADMTQLQHQWKIIADRIRREANREKREANDRIETTVLHKRCYEFDRIWKRDHPNYLTTVKTVAERLRTAEALEECAREERRRRRAARGAAGRHSVLKPPEVVTADERVVVSVPVTVIEGERERLVSVPVVVTYSEERHGPVTISKVLPS
jgi:hypothetical protein